MKKRIKYPIIVEGKYDKTAICSIFDATVITTGGFSIFNSKEKQSLIRKLAESGGIIILTDSDGGGKQIRSFLSGIVPKEKIFNLYSPQIKGKERRKNAPSKAGLLGVEGVGREVLEKVLSPFAASDACEENGASEQGRMLTKVDFFVDGLSGGESSSAMRAELSSYLDFPRDMSANALIEAINLTVGFLGYRAAYRAVFGKDTVSTQ